MSTAESKAEPGSPPPVATRRRAWKWWIGWAVVSLMIGVVVTVGVAWRCAWRASLFYRPGIVTQKGMAEWRGTPIGFTLTEYDVGVCVVQHHYWQSAPRASQKTLDYLRQDNPARIPWWSIAEHRELQFEESTDVTMAAFSNFEMGCGWPWVTMVGRVLSMGPTDLEKCEVQGIVLERYGPGLVFAKLLPTQPAWRGFFGSTAIVAAVVVPIPSVIGWVRSKYRRLPGSCSKCGYDMTGVPHAANGVRTCPECGAQSRAERVGVA